MRIDDQRTEELFRSELTSLYRRTDVMFAVLMVVQFAACILAAMFIAPKTWAGDVSNTHIHVWAAGVIGFCLTALPVALVIYQRGRLVTRYTIAIAQMLFSALLIHLTGGRIETHFHVFGSLAFLAIYRDWRVLIPATIVIAVDHFVRGMFWPESVFGVMAAGTWRAFEHAGWVVFEDIFLIYSCVKAERDIRAVAQTRTHLERTNASIEQQVRTRTEELSVRTQELRASEERFDLAVQGSQDAIWDWDLITNQIHYSPRWKELLCSADEALSNSPEEWFSRIVSGGLTEFHDALTACIDGTVDNLDIEIAMHNAFGATMWLRCRAAAVRNSRNRAVRLAGSLADMTDLKTAHETLRNLAQHDRLTGLPNRELFTDRVQRAAIHARRNSGHHFAVLFFDFDRFKLVNDSLGHEVGDRVLISIARRLTANLRESDTAARFGGDEFVVLLDHLTDPDDAEKKVMALIDALREPHLIDTHQIVSTASVGLVLSNARYEDAASMIRDADAAMYQAKMNGKAQYRVFDTEMHAAVTRRLTIEQEMRNAVDTNQFEVWYQPIVSLRTGEIEGVEALLRWNHPSRGVLGPDDFLSVAEETGLIIPIGLNAMRQACTQIQQWQGMFEQSLRVGINLSHRQLVHSGTINSLRTILKEVGIDPSIVKLEVTESTVMDPRHDVVSIMKQIKALGVSLAMDNFGTGYSSLSCLHSFPIAELKVDRDFVRSMTKRREFTAVMHAIVTLAGNLNLTVIAEGIETPEQLAQLQAMDCASGQGYLFSRPLPATDMTAMLAKTTTFAVTAPPELPSQSAA